jgi:phage terminase small subunit
VSQSANTRLARASEAGAGAPGSRTDRALDSEVSPASAGVRPPPRASAGGLTRKERLFVGEYLLDFNGTRAAIRAGYAARSAHVTASRVLRKAEVAAAVEAEKAARIERLRMDADEVLRRQVAIARANVLDSVVSTDT